MKNSKEHFPPLKNRNEGFQWGLIKPFDFLFQPVHLEYVFTAANLRAQMYGMEQNRDRDAISQMVQNVKVPEFTPQDQSNDPIGKAWSQII